MQKGCSTSWGSMNLSGLSGDSIWGTLRIVHAWHKAVGCTNTSVTIDSERQSMCRQVRNEQSKELDMGHCWGCTAVPHSTQLISVFPGSLPCDPWASTTRRPGLATTCYDFATAPLCHLQSFLAITHSNRSPSEKVLLTQGDTWSQFNSRV